MKREGKIIALHLRCAIQNPEPSSNNVCFSRNYKCENCVKTPYSFISGNMSLNLTSCRLPVKWLTICQHHKANKLLSNLIGLIVKRCPGAKYPAWDEVSKQNPTSDLQEQSVSQPTLLLSPFCFATEKKHICLGYHTEEYFNKYQVEKYNFLSKQDVKSTAQVSYLHSSY